jgi:predicted nucleotidyltransferase
MAASWEITPEKVDQAIEKIIHISQPKKLILFGSYIQGKSRRNSDLDILIVSGSEIRSARKESVRIRRALKGIEMAIDILVVPEDKLEELSASPGLIYREALNKGKVVYESAQ